MRGSIHKRIHYRKNGKTSVLYYAVVETTRPGTTKRTQDWGRGHRTKVEAEADLLRRLKEERRVDSKMLLGVYLAEHWLPQLGDRIEPTTAAGYVRVLARIIPRIGRIPLRDVAPMHLNQLYTELRRSGLLVRYGPNAGSRQPLSPKTVRRVHAVLSKAFNDAIDEGLLTSNPARRAKPPRERSDFEVTIWSTDELAAFLDFVVEDHLYPIWLLAAATGMRRGELAGLQWRDIDFMAGTVLIRQTRTLVGRTVITKAPKNGQPRVINVDGETLAALSDLRRHRPWAAADDFVMLGPDDEPLHPDRLSHLFRRLAQLAGLQPIRLHDLRHTHASLLIKEGVPIKVVSERLGHADPGFTMRTYPPVRPGMQAAAAEVFAALLRNTPKRVVDDAA